MKTLFYGLGLGVCGSLLFTFLVIKFIPFPLALLVAALGGFVIGGVAMVWAINKFNFN